MKNLNYYLIFSFLLFATISITAQTNSIRKIPNITAPGVSHLPATGFEVFLEADNLTVPEEWWEQYYASQLAESGAKEIWMGNTYYDLMTNSSPKHRVHNNVGRTCGVWTFHEGIVSGSTYPTRGTGYNCINDGASNMNFSAPVSRLEENTRTGWPNIVILESGRELIASHSANREIILLTKEESTGEWTETTLPTSVGGSSGPGLLWPNLDASDNKIHLICLTAPVDLDGAVYEGINGALLYFRSMDGGMTWDRQDVLLPDVNSDNFSSFNADGYFIDANGENVVIAAFNGVFGDVDIWVSDDSGINWIHRKALDFPIDNYAVDDGYTLEQIGEPDPDGPAGDGMGGIDPEADDNALYAVKQCDGTGSVAIDLNGTVHAAFGRMYISDIDTNDGGWIGYPRTSGIFYWNSVMADDEPIVIEETIDATDIDGNGTLDIRDNENDYIPDYGGSSITSNPYIVVNDEGYAVIAYHQVMENFVREAIDGSPTFPTPEHYRQIFVTASLDKVNWQVPYHVNNPDVMIIPSIIPETEAVYPNLAYGADGQIHLTFQWDVEPGVFVRDDIGMITSEPTNNTETYWCFDVPTLFPSVHTEVVRSDVFSFEINPNPSSGKLIVEYELAESASSSIQISNMMGQFILSKSNGQESAGKYAKHFDLNHLSAGIYLVTLKNEDKVAVQKLVVE